MKTSDIDPVAIRSARFVIGILNKALTDSTPGRRRLVHWSKIAEALHCPRSHSEGNYRAVRLVVNIASQIEPRIACDLGGNYYMRTDAEQAAYMEYERLRREADAGGQS